MGNDELSLLLSKEAGDAKNSAKEAADAAERAKKVADAAEARAIALTPRNLTVEQETKLFRMAGHFKKLPATMLWAGNPPDPEISHIVAQFAMVLEGSWDMQVLNPAFSTVVVPGIQIKTFSSASQGQRQAARALGRILSKDLKNVSVSIDKRVTPPGKTKEDVQGAFEITIGPLVWGTTP